MKGSIGTPMTIETGPKKKYKHKARNNRLFCKKCRDYISKGEWVSYSHGLPIHAYKCPSAQRS